jgi:anthranilate/para-aminobenzoate synthase component I
MRFAQDKFDTKTMQLNINLAINAFWAWTNKFQYDNVSDSAGIFSRIKFEPQAGEVYQLVLSRSFEVDDEFSRFKTQQQQLAIKGVYSYRF